MNGGVLAALVGGALCEWLLPTQAVTGGQTRGVRIKNTKSAKNTKSTKNTRNANNTTNTKNTLHTPMEGHRRANTRCADKYTKNKLHTANRREPT